MSPTKDFALLANGTALPWAEIPEWPAAELVRATGAALRRGGRLSAWFGVPEEDGTRIVAVIAFDADNTLAVGRSPPARGSYPALTPEHPQAHLFERELFEQHALTPENHPWLKPVRRSNAAGDAPENGEFFRVSGSEIHEVAVGPVHAGVIEPGHFRFQCAGEEVLHLEIALGYQHRGIENALRGGPHRASWAQIETIAGDTTIGHATASATVLEALAGIEAPLRAQWLRALALELERLANHTGDLGALANDVAFLPTSAACGKIRGDFLNLTALLCGNRFGRHLVRPGACVHDLEPTRIATLIERLRRSLADSEQAAAWLWDAASVRARFENTGVVPAVVVSSDDFASFDAAFNAGADEVVHEHQAAAEVRIRLDAMLRRSDRDLYVHPSTRLPGAVEIEGEIARRLSLGELTRALGLPSHHPHDAIGDALTTAQVFLALATHLDALRPETVRRLVSAERRLQSLLAYPLR